MRVVFRTEDVVDTIVFAVSVIVFDVAFEIIPAVLTDVSAALLV
jgi:hypothetical protein